MKKIIFIRFSPTSKILGDTLGPKWFKKKGYRVSIVDLSLIYRTQEDINNYFTSDYWKFKFDNILIFRHKKKST